MKMQDPGPLSDRMADERSGYSRNTWLFKFTELLDEGGGFYCNVNPAGVTQLKIVIFSTKIGFEHWKEIEGFLGIYEDEIGGRVGGVGWEVTGDKAVRLAEAIWRFSKRFSRELYLMSIFYNNSKNSYKLKPSIREWRIEVARLVKKFRVDGRSGKPQPQMATEQMMRDYLVNFIDLPGEPATGSGMEFVEMVRAKRGEARDDYWNWRDLRENEGLSDEEIKEMERRAGYEFPKE